MQIAIDTSTEIASIALVQGDELLGELTWRCGQSHTVQLLPNLTHLLAQVRRSLNEATGIIVARGPGSYNGLRVGLSTAKGLAFSLGVPIVGISTLEADAYQHAGTGKPVCPIYNAGRDELGIAVYRMVGGEWRQLVAEKLTTLEALSTETREQTVFCGDFLPAVAEKLKHNLGGMAITVTPAARLRRAGYLAELGRKRLEGGACDDVATLQAFYFRGPSITKPRRPPPTPPGTLETEATK